MATNLSIDPELLAKALLVSGERTKKAAVTRALTEFIARLEKWRILDLFAKLERDPDFDYQVERSREGTSWWIPASGRWRCAEVRRRTRRRFGS